MALPRKYRLIKKSDFDRVFKDGKAVRGSFLFIKFLPNKLGFSRFGFSVSKKIYPKAVNRNQVKRVLAEVAAGYLKSGQDNRRDFIVVPGRREKEDLIKKDLSTLLGLRGGQ